MVSNAAAPLRGVFEGIVGAKLITSGDDNVRNMLGRGKACVPSISSTSPSGSTDAFGDDSAATFTKLVDSSTISIPISSQASCVVAPPRYKTMPSPTRANTILPESKCLNEIFEEGTDIGSSDTSTTTTPRPVVRQHFSNVRSNNHSPANNSAQRRSKLHKSRTASCSSSDDDDSENRKKRTQKIEDSTKVFQSQRRDSHDDSSDSQDPSNNAAGGTNSSAGGLVGQFIVSSKGDGQTESHGTKRTEDTNTNGRQKTGQPIGFRKTRAGRRRAGETRLRESQSLNRITEVQESELPLAAIIGCASVTSALPTTPSIAESSSFQSSTNAIAPNTSPTVSTATTHTHKSMPATKPNKLGFKFFHGFRKTDSSSSAQPKEKCSVPAKSQAKYSQQSNWNSHGNDPGHDDLKLGLDLQKTSKSPSDSHKGTSAAKKLKMLGRYFQVRGSRFLFSLRKHRSMGEEATNRE